MKLHVESMYGLYHGQDPRCFDPDEESCTPQEIAAHKAAVIHANQQGWHGDTTRSGCHLIEDNKNNFKALITTTAFGIGVYEVVVDAEGAFVRDATFADLCKSEEEGTWEE